MAHRRLSTAHVSVAAAGLVVVLALAAPAQAGRLVTWETKSAHVDPAKEPMTGPIDGQPRGPGLRVNVHLPDGYDGVRCRPVLYLTHGGFGSYEYWAHPTKLDIRNVAKGFPGIIVMPESGALGGGIDYWNGGKRGDPAWATYHLNEVIPLAESRLKICPGRRNHAIGGYSAGGLTAVLHAAARPDYFGSVAAFSGLLAPKRPEFWTAFSAGAAALWPDYFGTDPMYHQLFGDPVAQGFYWDGHDPLTLAANLRHTRVFFSHGDAVPRGPSDLDHPVKPVEGEAILMADDFERAARQAGLSYTRFRHPGVHDYPHFKLAVAEALGWGFFGHAAASPPSWAYKTVARRGRMWDLRFEFAQPPDTLAVFERDGRRLKARGSGTVRIRTGGGCELTAALPFERDLSEDCAEGGCLARRSPIGPRSIGRVRLGYTRGRALGRIAPRPARRSGRAFRWCVKGSSRRVTAVFGPGRSGRIRLVTTTAPGHGLRGVGLGRSAAALRRALPRRLRVMRGVYQASPRSLRILGLRRGRVRFAAVADRRLLRNPRALRRYLKLAGHGPT